MPRQTAGMQSPFSGALKKKFPCRKNVVILHQKYDIKVAKLHLYITMESTENKIVRRIRGRGRGSLVFMSDFADCGTPSSIKSAFHRLYANGNLLRLSQGIYYYPQVDTSLGLGVLYPSFDDIADAIAKRDHARIVPTGAYALNHLGLSTQVPMNVVYITSGAPRKVKIGENSGILFKHSSSGKLFSFQSQYLLLVVMAMKEIGQERITDEQIAILKNNLSNVPSSEFNHDIKLMPIWIRQILMKK